MSNSVSTAKSRELIVFSYCYMPSTVVVVNNRPTQVQNKKIRIRASKKNNNKNTGCCISPLNAVE